MVKTPQEVMKDYADQQEKQLKHDKKVKKYVAIALATYLAFWYSFNEKHPKYTHADDSRLTDKQLKSELDEVAKSNNVKTKGVSNNADLIEYAAYVAAAISAGKLVSYIGDQLSKRLISSAKVGQKVYDLPKSPAKKSIVDDLMQGVHWSDRIWSNQEALRSDLVKIMKQSLLSHDNPVSQTQKIRDRFDVSRSSAERILRTESSRVMSKQSLENVRQAGYEKVTWICNSGACKICLPKDGKVYMLDEADGLIPAHPNCLCTWVAVFDGIKLKNQVALDYSNEKDENYQFTKTDWDMTAQTRLSGKVLDILNNKLSNAPENMQKLFANYLSQIRYLGTTTDEVSSFRFGEGVTINLAEIFSKYRNNFDVIYHEYAHGIDYVSRIGGLTSDGTLGRAIYDDANKLLSHADQVNKLLQSIPPNYSGDISDMLNGATSGKVTGLAGHQADYWDDDFVQLSREGFAEMTSATINNPDSLKLIKKYLPNAYEKYLSLVDEVIE